jgi:hypothetical protein
MVFNTFYEGNLKKNMLTVRQVRRHIAPVEGRPTVPVVPG